MSLICGLNKLGKRPIPGTVFPPPRNAEERAPRRYLPVNAITKGESMDAGTSASAMPRPRAADKRLNRACATLLATPRYPVVKRLPARPTTTTKGRGPTEQARYESRTRDQLPVMPAHRLSSTGCKTSNASIPGPAELATGPRAVQRSAGTLRATASDERKVTSDEQGKSPSARQNLVISITTRRNHKQNRGIGILRRLGHG